MPQKPMQLNVSLDKTTEIICEKCNNNVFVEGLYLRKVSKLLAGLEKDGIVPVPVFSCSKCQHVNKDFIPRELQNDNSN